MNRFVEFITSIHEKKGVLASISLVGAVLLYIMLSFVTNETTYTIERFQLSPETIRSSKTIEDPLKTEQDRAAAKEAVDPVYVFQEEASDNQSAWTASVFESIIVIKEEALSDEQEVTSIQQLRKELEELSPELSERLSDSELEVIFTQPLSTLETTSEVAISEVTELLAEPIRSNQLSAVREQGITQLKERLPFPTNYENAVGKILSAAIIETELIDQELTNQRIEEAVNAVEPTRILQGQLLVQEGQYVDREIYRQLELTGMVENDVQYRSYAGLAVLILLTVGMLYSAIHLTEGSRKVRVKWLSVSLLVLALSALLMVLTALIDANFTFTIAFLFPTAFVSMTVYLLTNERLAYISLIANALLAGYIFREGFTAFLQTDIALYTLIGGLSGIFAFKFFSGRSPIMKTSGIVALTNTLFMVAYLLLSTTTTSMQDNLLLIGIGLLSGMISGAFTFGTLPFFESAFGILSTMKLFELANPGHPLLKKLLMETPGTYHHSVMVANLSEAACESIGANGLFARVACYYHDIGKTRRPGFFIENQTNGYNPHDHLPPETSAGIIKDHTTDGAAILIQNRIPRAIVDVALQHHGTTCIKYFYHKAKQDGDCKEEAFRYDGPKPQTREAAVISIADSVEAAVRSMNQPSSTKIKELVDAIVKDRVNDGQFDECDISMKDLTIVKESICSTLKGFYHERIQYPEEEKK